jgi:hypothetical protein
MEKMRYRNDMKAWHMKKAFYTNHISLWKECRIPSSNELYPPAADINEALAFLKESKDALSQRSCSSTCSQGHREMFMCYPNTSACVTSPPRNPDVHKSKFNLVTTSPSTEKKSIDVSALDKVRLPFDLSKPKNPNYSTSIVAANRMLNFSPPYY